MLTLLIFSFRKHLHMCVFSAIYIVHLGVVLFFGNLSTNARLDPAHPTPTSVSEFKSALSESSWLPSDPVSSLLVEASSSTDSVGELLSEAFFRFRLDDGMARRIVQVTGWYKVFLFTVLGATM